MTNHKNRFTPWRIVGIVITALLIVGGFFGAYALGVRNSAVNSVDDSDYYGPRGMWDEDGDYNSRYVMPHMYSGFTRGYVTPIFSFARILWFVFWVLIIGAFLRLLFFPFRFHHHPWRGFRDHRYYDPHYTHPHGPWKDNEEDIEDIVPPVSENDMEE